MVEEGHQGGEAGLERGPASGPTPFFVCASTKLAAGLEAQGRETLLSPPLGRQLVT